MIANVLNNKSVWKLLFLISYSPGSGYTRGELLKLTKWNNLSLDRVLKKLLFYNIIQKEGRIIKLNFEDIKTKVIVNLIEQEKKRLNYPSYELYLIITEFLRLVENKPIFAIYLFGSWAKKTASKSSDIDLAIFSKDELNLIKVQDKIEQRFEVKLQLHYFEEDTLKNKRDPLIKNILKDGIKIK